MLVEFWEDHFEANKSGVYEVLKGEDGDLELEMEDNLLEKWEKELAMGVDPDLTEGLSPQGLAVLERMKQKTSKAPMVGSSTTFANVDKEVLNQLDSINDNYSQYLDKMKSGKIPVKPK